MIALILGFSAGPGLTIERSEVSKMDKWDLTALYANIDAFKQERDAFLPDAKKLTEYKGKLGDSAANFRAALDLVYDLEKRLRRMESYAGRQADQDTRVSENKGYESEVEQLRTRLAELASYIDPEIVAIGKKKIDAFFKKDPKLAVYRRPVDEVIRRSAHILTSVEENLLAGSQDMAGTAYTAYNIFTNADMPRQTITLADGTELKMTYPNFDKVRRSLVEADRVKGFQTFFGQYDQFKRTLAQTLYGQLKAHRYYANSRKYSSTLASSLDYADVNEAIYHSLIEAAHRNLETFHRYLKLKARFLGKEKLAYTDMYVPFTQDVAITVDYKDAKAYLEKAFAPMGEKYVGTIRQAFDSGWIDVYPNEGKQSGAYSGGWSYEVHPYVLMNFNNTYSDTLTLAHELGHAMHSYLSNEAQPFPTASYETFVAEVASTFNENLLNDHMLKNVSSDDERLYLLGNFLDGTIKGTFFRQIQFAEFELLIHQKVEKGEALTDETLNAMYLKLTRKYYGHDKGVVDVPDWLAVEWAMIPHFYYHYYVFQYSTSVAAAGLLAQRVLDETPGALEAYMGMLQAGASTDPVTILKNAGADMTRPEAYQALMDRTNRYMDELEKVLDRRAAR